MKRQLPKLLRRSELLSAQLLRLLVLLQLLQKPLVNSRSSRRS